MLQSFLISRVLRVGKFGNGISQKERERHGERDRVTYRTDRGGIRGQSVIRRDEEEEKERPTSSERTYIRTRGEIF